MFRLLWYKLFLSLALRFVMLLIILLLYIISPKNSYVSIVLYIKLNYVQKFIYVVLPQKECYSTWCFIYLPLINPSRI